ncbi:phospholipid carrier-dependent glycosyltransferase [Trichothermofontia sp.]
MATQSAHRRTSPHPGLGRRYWVILGLLWLVAVGYDRLWFVLDRSVPAWDPADYLTGALNYWHALQDPHWFDPAWWRHFWLLSGKVPPLTYIATAPFFNLFGRGIAQATLLNLLGTLLILGSVYGLGVLLFTPRVGLWAAAICLLLPGLYTVRLDFLTDYPLVAMVTVSFFCLTAWRVSQFKIQHSTFRTQSLALNAQDSGFKRAGLSTGSVGGRDLGATHPYLVAWVWAIAFGVSFGLALLVKQTAVFFLLGPIVWATVASLRRWDWGQVGQLLGAVIVAVLIAFPWYRTNWFTIMTAGKQATVGAAIVEGDPPLHTLAAWTFYGQVLPYQVSWVLLLTAIGGWLVWLGKQWWRGNTKAQRHTDTKDGLLPYRWVLVFLVGGYLLASLNMNKDSRYTLAYLPVFSLWLAAGLLCWSGRWGRWVRWGAVGLATIALMGNTLPIAGLNIAATWLSPYGQKIAYRGKPWPHPEVIATMTATTPGLRLTLGVLPSTATVNQHNLNFFGALQDFQVYGRQVGVQQAQVPQDVRSLDWFITKTGDQGSLGRRQAAQAATVQAVTQGDDFQPVRTWDLPDGSQLTLHHRPEPAVIVKPETQRHSDIQANQIRLNRVIVPPQAPPGSPIPVTYRWSGPWEKLRSGLLLLTWQLEDRGQRTEALIHLPDSQRPIPGSHRPTSHWLHDHTIGFGTLLSQPPREIPTPTGRFRVIERTAMLPPADLPAGRYRLTATYLNRDTGETEAIAVPPTEILITPDAAPLPAPELDLVTQLRSLSQALPKGTPALEAMMAQISRINQYDPIQDYVAQAAQSLDYRLQHEPETLALAYNLVLARVLQRDTEAAIAALDRVIRLDPNNPYAYGYLAFVNLYDFRARAAAAALQPGLALAPNLPELQLLNGVAALLQGRVWAIRQIHTALNQL